MNVQRLEEFLRTEKAGILRHYCLRCGEENRELEALKYGDLQDKLQALKESLKNDDKNELNKSNLDVVKLVVSIMDKVKLKTIEDYK